MEDKVYKVKDPVSGLYWKGGGMNKNNKNNKSNSFLSTKSGYVNIDYGSEEHAIITSFSKKGKTWSSFRAVKSALGFGHESGLQKLLDKCDVVELVCTEKIIKR